VVTGQNQPGNCGTPSTCRFAFMWGRQPNGAPPAVPVTPASQESAIDALTAALPAARQG
jgi:hypothetical protein